MTIMDVLSDLFSQENFTTLILSTVLGLSVLIYFYRNRSLPPGPYGIPYLGYLLFLGDEPHVTLSRLAKRYGDICSFTVLGRTHIHLNSLDVIKEAFLDKAEDFSGREPGFSLLSWVDDGMGITATEGPVWKEQRQFFFQTVRRFGFGKSGIEGHIHEAVHKLLETVKNTKGKPFDIHTAISNSACDIICKVVVTAEIGSEVGDFKEISHKLRLLSREFVGPRVFLIGPLVKLLFPFLPGGKVLEDVKTMIHGIVRKLTKYHTETFDKNHLRDFTDCYLEELQNLERKKMANGTSFSMESLHANDVNLLIEGTESISATVYGMLRILMKHPEVQLQIQKEVDDVIGSERLPSYTDRTSLPFTESALYELQRLAIPFPLGGFHSNPRESTLKGYRIPKRSVIVANLWSVHMDPKKFPEPEKFNPRRFLNAQGKFERGEGLYLFGLGRRACIGESLAVMELFLFITALLQKFTLKDPGNNDEKASQFNIIAIPREQYLY